MAECLRQIVPNRWASIRKALLPNVFVFTRGATKVRAATSQLNQQAQSKPGVTSLDIKRRCLFLKVNGTSFIDSVAYSLACRMPNSRGYD